jgi:hypothetical protein
MTAISSPTIANAGSKVCKLAKSGSLGDAADDPDRTGGLDHPVHLLRHLLHPRHRIRFQAVSVYGSTGAGRLLNRCSKARYPHKWNTAVLSDKGERTTWRNDWRVVYYAMMLSCVFVLVSVTPPFPDLRAVLTRRS